MYFGFNRSFSQVSMGLHMEDNQRKTNAFDQDRVFSDILWLEMTVYVHFIHYNSKHLCDYI